MKTTPKFPPHPYTLRQLQYVVAVSQELSFRRAAEQCNVSQPSLSAQLAQLEDALGVRVFERSQKSVMLTAAGHEIVERAKRLLVDADDLLAAGRRSRDPLQGLVKVGVIPTISPYLLPSITPHLRATFPRLTLAWVEDKTDVLLGQLAEGSLDCALLALEADVGDVQCHVIAKDPFVLVTRREHALAKKTTPATAADLRVDDMLLLDDGHCFRNQALEVCNNVRAHEGAFRATSLSTLVQMVAGGVGITLLPELAVETETRRAKLHVRGIASPLASRTIALVWRKRSPWGPSLVKIAEAITETYPQRSNKPSRDR